MNVFFALDALINAGAEKSTLNLVRMFSKNTKVHVVYFYPMHDLREEYLKAGVQLHFLDLKGSYSFLKGIRKLIQLIKTEKADVVVSSILRANIMCRIACRLTGTKLIGTFISDSYSTQRTDTFSASRKLGFTFFKWIDRFTAGIPVQWISNSQSIAESNCRALKVPSSKVKVIYRGRDTSNIPQWEQPQQGRPFVFVSIGRLLETKGYQDIISALKKLTLTVPELRLEIYGEGSYRKQLEQLVADLNLKEVVTFYGNVPDAWKKLYKAHCFIFSSWYEGFSGALVEAMMTGVPIIASNIPMNLEAVTHKETALIHEVKNTADLVKKMQYMLENYEEMIEMGTIARASAFEHFDIKKIASQYEQFLYSVNEQYAS